jgi:NAD+ synthase (glutamine-hydrolysing)
MAKRLGASYRLGPELEVPGYGCEDHFFELDTVKHSWQVLSDILKEPDLTKDIICDIGMPVHFKNTLYNCRVICLNQEILLIRPKLHLAAGNNYRESRWFTAWMRDSGRAVEDFYLSPEISQIKGQKSTKFGNAIIRCNDTTIGVETCEELWVPKNPHVDYGLDGVEIIANGSASHHELRKLHTRLGLITNASHRNGGVYLYANAKGCDGGRMYFDGSSMICMNGKIYALDDQFSPDDVVVQVGVMDLDEVRSFRGGFNSRCN